MQVIQLVVIGKTNDQAVQLLIQEYAKRLQKFVSFEIVILPDIKQKSSSIDEHKEREYALLKTHLQATDKVFLLDERGDEYTSESFSVLIEQQLLIVPKRLLFIIGGSYGFSPKLYKEYPNRIALSKMTMNHQMVRAFMVEQLYRAFTIIHKHPYHH